jgi:hypothetical protein
VTWETELLALFDDLEQQAEGLALVQRDAEVAELARAEYAEVGLDARLHASVGTVVEIGVLGAGVLRGRLAGAGAGWCLLADGAPAASGHEWVVPVEAMASARGLATGARPEAARPLAARLGVASVLRRVAEAREEVLVVRRDGEGRRGRIGRVGADFLEVLSPDAGVELVPFRALGAVRSTR